MKDLLPACLIGLALSLPIAACTQPIFTANDQVPAYNEPFGYGANLGYFPPYYYDMELAALAHGTPDGQVPGMGVTTLRPGLFEHFLDYWGYDIRKEHFRYYDSIGLKNIVAIIGFPSEAHRDAASYCPGQQSELFKNLYEPIWDNGENGTPVNDNNPYALYCWKAATTYKGLIKTWEVWNEPDVDNGNAWKERGMPGNWWENAPEPCETKLKSPAYFYIRLLRISYEVIKSVDPDALIATGGLGWPSYLDVICRYTDNPFDGTESTDYPHKGGAYFDVMSFHSYPHLDNSLREWSNEINNFKYFRHSDRAVNGIWALLDKFDAVLKANGYDNSTYPEKYKICTEFNLPRKAFGEYMGSDEGQVNFMIKTLVTAQMRKVLQMHVYALSDEKPAAEANNEFSFMGLFENLNNLVPFQGKPNPVAWAMKTTEQMLRGARYDPVRTSRLNLPANIRGAAFRTDLGQYTYVLWAVTSLDKDETAEATYTFPPELNIQYLEARAWNYSKNPVGQLVNAKEVTLTGSPVFFRITNVDNNFPKEPKFKPNPVTNGVGVYEFWMFEDTYASIDLYDISGKLLQQIADQENMIEGPHALFIDLSRYPQGTYFIKLSTPFSNQTVKLVKQG
ncbi:MAG TPA: T9SS type A sorting domain-containing protein [Saprospiraceae bacterium]|nr:T9SS type A sorting domain-containing protein [Saprospiraceae bacterium]HPI06762.1 T9SS type A sorting domain-containing protein [Saprospiraceae bacterium]